MQASRPGSRGASWRPGRKISRGVKSRPPLVRIHGGGEGSSRPFLPGAPAMTHAPETLPRAAARLAELSREARTRAAPVLASKLSAYARAACAANDSGYDALSAAREGLTVDVRRYEVIAPGSPLTQL